METFQTYAPGDVNNSRDVTAADAIAMVGYVFRGAVLETPECVADINGDGVVTASDIILLIAHIFRGGPEPPGWCG